MAPEGLSSISVASVVEDVIKQHGTRLSDVDLASRKAGEAAARRNEAAAWLRRTVGVVGAKDLPEEPSEEEFRVGVRNGMILCNALNRVVPGAVPKVVEIHVGSNGFHDRAPLSAYQHFENVRNFLVVMEDIGLPTFEASDLEQGGKGSRVVDCVLALKFYIERRNVLMKNGGVSKPATSGKYFMRKNSEPFMNSLMKNESAFSMEQNLSADFSIESPEMTTSHSLNMLVSTVLSNKKPEEVPLLVESMLSKVMREFERRLASQKEQVSTTLKGLAECNDSIQPNHLTELSFASGTTETRIEDVSSARKEDNFTSSKTEEVSTFSRKQNNFAIPDKEHSPAISRMYDTSALSKKEYNSTIVRKEDSSFVSKREGFNMNEEILAERLSKQRLFFDKQQREIQEMKHTLHATRAGMELLKTQHYEEFSNLGEHFRVLAHAASGFRKVIEENRKLYNQVQDLKGNIRVYCRVRPFLPGQATDMTTIGRIDDGNITIITPSKYGKEARKSFTFNKVFGPSATQGEVFSDTQPLIRSVLDGYNVCIFAYGQTGSGKTYTMSGPRVLTEENLGVNYRALNDLFSLSEQRRETVRYEISVQMMEIYNEQVRDLLVNDGLNKKLEIRNSSQKGLSVPDANIVPVVSTSDVIELMNLGHRNRVVCSTAMNDHSSRSHSCLTVHVQGRDLISGTAIRGCMHLVDLAGSERVDKSEVKGERLKEAVHINKSLSALGDVIAALAQKNSHVPYRNSKLTQLLQDSLGGQAKTLMFVHISPEADSIGETISTLKFAERVATVELGAARSNKESPEIKELKEQVASLKAALARKGSDHELIQSTISSPDVFRTTYSGSTSPLRHEDDLGCIINNRQPVDDVRNIEVRSDSAMRLKKANYDFQELLLATNSQETGFGEWVDKTMVNKHEAIKRDDDSSRDWERDYTSAPDFFYQRYLPDTTVHSEQYRRNAPGSVTTDDSDDMEIGTSDYSEVDMGWQLNSSKVISNVTRGGSITKKPQPKPMKSQDTRTPTRSHIPSPSRKVSNGPNQTLNRTGRPAVIDGKRSSTGKTGSNK